jgi:hypothetical protein
VIKPETRFSNLLHKRLDPSIYYEKTNNPFRSGMPDFYYEGAGRILWSEHKWIEKPWTKRLEPSEICKTKSWIQQRRWLNRAYTNGVATCVIVGVGSGRQTRAYWLEYPYVFDNQELLGLEAINELLYERISQDPNTV